MPRLIMRAGTVHVLLLSWQNQSPSCCECTQTGSCHIATAGVRLSLRTPDELPWKTFCKISYENLKCDFLFCFHPKTLIQGNSILTHRRSLSSQCAAVRGHFLNISANLGGTAANYNLKLMNLRFPPPRVPPPPPPPPPPPNQCKWLSPHTENGLFVKWRHEKKL